MGRKAGTTDAPLVSIVLVGFNHEPYIRDAVRSALAQTYQPLEIILSDDNSPDRTFEIMKEEADAYRGPHKIILNRNETNLGVAPHYNRAAGLASGELLIIQDGDDISAPERAAKVVKAWQEPTPVDMVCTNVRLIDSSGAPMARQRDLPPVSPMTLAGAVEKGWVSALGCACAYSRTLWTTYGPMAPEVLQEDVVLPFRALLGRGIRVVDEPLVDYRIHDSNLFAGQVIRRSRETRRRWARSWLAITEDWQRAWELSGHSDPALSRRLRLHLKQRQYDADLYEASRWTALIASVRAVFDGLSARNIIGLIVRHVLRLSPRSAFRQPS